MPQLSEDRPIYLQLKEYLEKEILEGRIGDEEQIPSTNELAAFFEINPITVLKGVGMLVDEGLVYKKRGVGMFVSSGAQALIQKHYRERFVRDAISPLIQHARSLQLTRKEIHEYIDAQWDEEDKEQSHA